MSNTDNKTQALFGDVGSDLLVKKDEQRRCMGCMEEFSAEFDLCPNCGYVVGTQSRLKCYLQPGLWLAGNYMLGKVIGQGGFGITYIAWDKKNERKLRLKSSFLIHCLPGKQVKHTLFVIMTRLQPILKMA